MFLEKAGDAVNEEVFMEESIYGSVRDTLPLVMEDIKSRILKYAEEEKKVTGIGLIEHMSSRIKEEESMREKCVRKGLPVTPHTALYELHDAIGIRIVSAFIDDVYRNVVKIREFADCEIVEEKDYIKNAKPNGYRSFHMILKVKEPFEDVNGNNPGEFFVEIQLRTIAMDSWAALEHKLKYKKNIRNTRLIELELKRCADEMASTDLSMQTIRDLILEDEE